MYSIYIADVYSICTYTVLGIAVELEIRMVILSERKII